MALTAFEKNIARRMLASWSGRIPIGGELNDTKYQEFMEGNEASRRALIVAYITETLLPFERETRANLIASAQEANQRAAVLSAYVSV